ncbi:MAG TPA: hypothetical protein VKG82_07755 [Solirubrobacteraceae bacterium]|nr:hypothetical protein [Solirubrobacteraceae bacterium]HME04506.1 hypothetical protein [Solirubrobacteraceae bacterium]
MAEKRRSGRLVNEAWASQGERYLQRLLEDDQLRARLLGAYVSARSAYGRLSNGKSPTHALFEDAKLQRELLDAAHALREASVSLMEPAPKPKKRRHRVRRSLMLIVVGAVLAVALSADLRKKVLDMMFGAEETFDYSSTTTPPTPAPSPVAG